MNRTKAIETIINLLRIDNNRPRGDYAWVARYSDKELQQMLSGWQRNHPHLFARHGYYVL